jgi:hypothetical protein
MRLLRALALCLAVPVAAAAQVSAPVRVIVQDEGTTQGGARILNCTGSGISCSVSGTTATLNASGGAGSSNFAEVSVDLGTGGGLIYTVTVTGQAWVGATSQILCTPFSTSADGQTVETVYASGVQCLASNRVAATGFDLTVYSPHGATGTYRFHVTGS